MRPLFVSTVRYYYWVMDGNEMNQKSIPQETGQKRYKNPVCIIRWMDAAYSYEEKLPDAIPEEQLTAGFIVEATDDYTNIATNVGYNPGTTELHRVDGIVIPEKTIIEFRRIGNLNDD